MFVAAAEDTFAAAGSTFSPDSLDTFAAAAEETFAAAAGGTFAPDFVDTFAVAAEDMIAHKLAAAV